MRELLKTIMAIEIILILMGIYWMTSVKSGLAPGAIVVSTNLGFFTVGLHFLRNWKK